MGGGVAGELSRGAASGLSVVPGGGLSVVKRGGGGGLPAVPRVEAVASRNAAVTNTTRTCDTRPVRVTFL
jgi:hypothetical protein